MSTQHEDIALTTKQPPGVQQKKMWVWKPRQPATSQKPQQQVKTHKMICQKRQQVQVSDGKPLSSTNPPTNLQTQGLSEINLKALQLQIKLFGLSSVLLSKQSWLRFVRRQQGYRTLADRPLIQVKPLLLHTSRPLS